MRAAVAVFLCALVAGCATSEPEAALDPGLAAIDTDLAETGADIVQPVPVTFGERPMVIATSLGNFLFGQAESDQTIYMLEAMVDAAGIVAYRVGRTARPDRRVDFDEWLEPIGDAAWLDGSWWTLIRKPTIAPTTAITINEFRHGDLVTAAAGDVNGDGSTETVASFRRPHESTPFMETHPEVQWVDAEGRDAHLGVYRPDGLVEIWVAGTVLMPIASLEVCDGSLAVVHDKLDDPAPVAAGAWTWNGFGFDTAPTLDGGGTPACADIDGDGVTEPVIVARY